MTLALGNHHKVLPVLDDDDDENDELGGTDSRKSRQGIRLVLPVLVNQTLRVLHDEEGH